MKYEFDKEIDSTKLQEELHEAGIEVSRIDTNGTEVEIYTDSDLNSDQVVALNETVSSHNKDSHSLGEEAEKRMNFGASLFKDISKKVWVINTQNEMNGSPLTTPQMQSLLGTSDQIQKSLESGSLKTAKYILGLLKSAFPIYSDVADFATNEINNYLGI